jgi:hypothetical protein
MVNEDLKSIITLQCERLSLQLENFTENNFKIFSDESSGINLFIEIDSPTNFSFYFLQRTHDVIYHGDRSDAHVVLSLMFACFLRCYNSGISCSFFDIAHPAIENEIWGRYIMPEQMPSFIGFSTIEKRNKAISELIETTAFWRLIFWNFASCPCDDCLKENNIDPTRVYDLPKEFMFAINTLYKSPKNINYGGRIRPNWNYLYDIDHEITIIKSEELSNYLESLVLLSKRLTQTLKGINGKLILDGELKNFLSNKTIKILNKLSKNLHGNLKPVQYVTIPFENMVLVHTKPYIIALGRLSGLQEFKTERELLRDRHNKEAEVLFPISIFEWNENPCPDQFEKLIKALLEREPNIKTVRRPAPINQGDKGRDLLIEWNIIDQYAATQISPPTTLIKVVGQCKASNKTIGKSNVLDIRDTVETHQSQGYFLAVNTQISAPLTEKLEQLQSLGIWTSWWNREDIETRLSKNQDLIPNFPKVVTAKNKIKFVDN